MPCEPVSELDTFHATKIAVKENHITGIPLPYYKNKKQKTLVLLRTEKRRRRNPYYATLNAKCTRLMGHNVIVHPYFSGADHKDGRWSAEDHL